MIVILNALCEAMVDNHKKWLETLFISGRVLWTENQLDSGEDRRILLASVPNYPCRYTKGKKGSSVD